MMPARQHTGEGKHMNLATTMFKVGHQDPFLFPKEDNSDINNNSISRAKSGIIGDMLLYVKV
jgi:hypothetical protein